MDLEKSVEGLKKFLEGWVAHRNELAKTWKKYWMVLKGNVIFLFTSEKTNKENLAGNLSLGSGTYVADIKSKKGFKFELTTLNQRRETTKNTFKFSKEDDFHLWKAYILAIATGIIPNDVQLLPGQRLDVYDAIVEIKRHLSPVSGPGAPASGPGPRRSSCPGGPTTNGPRRPSEPSNRINHDYHLERLEDEEEVQNDPLLLHIQQLERRREDIAKRDIGGINLSSSATTLAPFGSPLLEIPFVSPLPEPKSPLPHSQSATSLQGQGSVGQRSTTGSQGQKSTASPSQGSSFLSSPHPFYSETAGNNNDADPPSWFVNCSRAQAEEILTATKKLGTVLMRANSRFPVTGNYVISFRRELEGKVVVSHYNIIRSPEGFKIDVENKHEAMSSLSTVMDFFLSVAGATARPLTCNDLTQLLGKYQAAAFPSVSSSDDLVQMRSQNSDSRKPRQRIDAFVSSPIATPSGSNRSSDAKSSSGSPGSRTSRVSFDFSSRRPSDPHHGYTRQSSMTSSGVFYAGGSVSSAPGPQYSVGSVSSAPGPQYSVGSVSSAPGPQYSVGSVSSAPGPQRSAFSASPCSGSLRESVYSEAVPVSPDKVQSIRHGPPVLRGTISVPDNLEIYANHDEVMPTESSGTWGTGTSGTLTSGTGTETESRTNGRGSQSPSIAGSSASHGSYGFGSHMNRLPSPPQSTYGSGSSQGTYGPGTSWPGTHGSGPSQSTYGSGSSPGTYGPGLLQGTYGPGSSQSTYGPGSSQSTYKSGPSQSSTYGSGSSQGTYGPGTLQSTRGSEASSTHRSPLQSTYGNDTQSSRASSSKSSPRSDSQSTLSTKGYGHKPGTPGQSTAKIPPPAPPPKPSSQEIYIMMKPVDDAYGKSTVEESNGAQQSVKDLARMLQCAVTLGK